MMTETVLYSDFNCPFCYAMHERLGALEGAGRVQWRGVQHAPFLRTPMQMWAGRLGEELSAEVLAVRRLMPDLPINDPRGKPNTRRAITAAARASVVDAERAWLLIRSLYRAFWVDGQDISDPAVVTRLWTEAGYAESTAETHEMPVMAGTLAEWERTWIETGHGSVPVLHRADGAVLVGLAGRDQLRAFLAAACT